jgi:S-adenosylmethionine-dependent methyltransferase
MDRVEHYYNEQAATEWLRLERHRTEFAVTLRALNELLPAPPATILDIGGGPGRYAIALTQQGYSVTLLDLSQHNLALAAQYAAQAGVELAASLHANALNLISIANFAYDAVLLLGPLYHLQRLPDRQRAIREALQKLIPHGLLVAAFITRYAPLRYLAKHQPDVLMTHPQFADELLTTGTVTTTNGFLAHAYFADPFEVQPFMEDAGLQTLQLRSCEGLVSGIEDNVNLLQGAAWERWVDLNYRVGQDPALWGVAEHLLYIGRKS